MSQSLTEIAQELKNNPKKAQLIYAFNGTGKTRLSRAFKALLASEIEGDDGENTEHSELSRKNILYYNAFTEDLFYWDNDLDGDETRKLKIHPNAFTKWVLEEQGQDQNVIGHFQRYTNPKLTPHFNEEYTHTNSNHELVTVPAFSEVNFSFERGNEEAEENIKISKGEESNFIWSIFYSLLAEVVDVLNVTKPHKRETAQFNQLQYVFIDDPVSSLDENHLMQLAVDLASLIRKSTSSLKFIISTHDTTFYNCLHNELKSKSCYLLESFEGNSVSLTEKKGDSNTSFFYHLDLKKKLELAIKENNIQRTDFLLIRNLYEKTASFLGFPQWSELLPGDNEENKQAYLNRIIQFSSHDNLANAQSSYLRPEEKQTVKFLLEHLLNNYGFKLQGAQNA
ncbi:AAA family ATPase [Shewanella sp. 202IG2-18]|uniref:AAA family ATPase n=1 Tax=Parashewanella hymeniacidonis TaxID=2807618 RepID=UPI001960F87F|nr:AAA family ATPase [Parashewanella hymeniacidonis]MBM7070602.1 AAA family ATPase [Parashewanella hymeniacidonis]